MNIAGMKNGSILESFYSGIVLLTQLLLLGPIPYTVGKAADGQVCFEGELCKGSRYLAEKNILLVSLEDSWQETAL